jgi:peptidoglycan hydrolase CwlO-like protein
MVDDKIKVCARVPSNIYDICLQRYDNITNAINACLELLCRQECPTSGWIKNNETLKKELENKEPDNKEILQLQFRIQDLQENQQARIADLKEQIQALNEQINKKDNQIEELNQTLMAQASNIYNLTQNTKLLPAEKSKKWWMFWKS